MALMYFKDGETRGGKQWMAKTTVREILAKKEREHGSQVEALRERADVLQASAQRQNKIARQWILISGVLFGIDILLAILWSRSN